MGKNKKKEKEKKESIELTDNSSDKKEAIPSNKPEEKSSDVDSIGSETLFYIKCINFAKIIGIFSLIILSATLISDITAYQDQRTSIKAEIDNYYYNGWDINDLRDEYIQSHGSNLLLSYGLSNLSGDYASQYRSKLYREIDLQKIDIEDEIRQKARVSSMFYITEIKQDTTELETYFEELRDGETSENLYIINWSLNQIDYEIAILAEKQDQDIEEKIQQKTKKLKDIAFLASYYRRNLNGYIVKAEEITKKDQKPIDSFIEIDGLISQSKKELEEGILGRGGFISENKQRIVVIIRSQRLYMIEDNEIIYEMPASTGVYHHATVPGEFSILSKTDMVWGYYEIWMPYWMTIYYAGSSANGIHGIPISPSGQRWSHWESVIGVSAITYGCIMPKDHDAKILYEWAEVGTPVTIFY